MIQINRGPVSSLSVNWLFESIKDVAAARLLSKQLSDQTPVAGRLATASPLLRLSG
jgi:hypothetical protein